MMERWAEYNLSDVLTLIGGGTPKTTVPEYWNGDIPWISVVDFVGDRKIIYQTEKSITQKGLQNSSTKMLLPNDIIISARGTVGELGMVSRPMAFNQSCYGIRANKNIVNGYLFYLLKEQINELKSISHGSVFSTITRETFDQIQITLPPLPLQHRIAEILGALDDKIELNRQMNHTLEQMAQSLYKHYFVDDIDPQNLPEGWRIGKLNDVLSLEYGKSLREPERQGGKYPVIGSSGIVGYHSSSLVKADGIVVGRKGNAGSVLWCSKDFFPIDTTFYVVNKLSDQRYHFLFYLLKSLKLEGYNSDSAVPGLNRNQAHNIDIKIPSDQTIENFNSYLVGLFDLIEANTEELDHLSVIRDYLLPKLLSGELIPADLEPIEYTQ